MARQSTGLGTPIAMFGILAAGLLIVLSKKPAVPAKSPSTGAMLTADQQATIAAALQALGIDASGKATRRATPTAVERARSLARTLSAAGFPEAASTLNTYAALAEKAPT